MYNFAKLHPKSHSRGNSPEALTSLNGRAFNTGGIKIKPPLVYPFPLKKVGKFLARIKPPKIGPPQATIYFCVCFLRVGKNVLK